MPRSELVTAAPKACSAPRTARAPSAKRSARVLGAAGAASIVVHLWSAFTGSHSVWMSTVMILMAAACAPCAVTAFTRCTLGTLRTMVGIAAGSAVMHAAWLIAASVNSGGHGGHTCHTGEITLPACAHTGHGIGMVVIIALEIAIVIIALDALSQSRSVGARRGQTA